MTDAEREVHAGLLALIEREQPGATDVKLDGLRRTTGGLSRENWPFDARWSEDGVAVEKALIMRRDPVGSVLETDRRVEFAVLRALQDASDIPSPPVLWLDATGELLGRPSLVMERFDGVNDHFVIEGGLSQFDADHRLRLAKRYCETLAALHRFDWRSAGLGDVLDDPGLRGADAAIDEWEAYLFRQTSDPQPELVEIIGWLRANAPEAQATVLVHGDFKPGNSLLRDGDLQVMLDWETVHLGDPIEDIGWVTNPMRKREHQIPGVWETEQLAARYARCTGFDVDPAQIHFWNVFACFKTNAILLTGVRSFREARSERPWADNGQLTRLIFDMIGWR